MNVIFLDFDGVLNTIHYSDITDVERRIKILSEICKKYNCKVVIEASAKDLIDEKTNIPEKGSWVEDIYVLFKKYDIDCIGRTPNVEKSISKFSTLPMWKEDEILLYLENHPEIEHFCVIDDDDAKYIHNGMSDLDKVREYLVSPIFYSKNPEEEGLLTKHIDEVGEILKKEMIINKKR